MLTHFRKFILITLFSLYNIPLSAQLLPSSYNTFEGKPEVVIELKKLIDQSDLDVSLDPYQSITKTYYDIAGRIMKVSRENKYKVPKETDLTLTVDYITTNSIQFYYEFDLVTVLIYREGILAERIKWQNGKLIEHQDVSLLTDNNFYVEHPLNQTSDPRFKTYYYSELDLYGNKVTEYQYDSHLKENYSITNHHYANNKLIKTETYIATCKGCEKSIEYWKYESTGKLKYPSTNISYDSSGRIKKVNDYLTFFYDEEHDSMHNETVIYNYLSRMTNKKESVKINFQFDRGFLDEKIIKRISRYSKEGYYQDGKPYKFLWNSEFTYQDGVIIAHKDSIKYNSKNDNRWMRKYLPSIDLDKVESYTVDISRNSETETSNWFTIKHPDYDLFNRFKRNNSTVSEDLFLETVFYGPHFQAGHYLGGYHNNSAGFWFSNIVNENAPTVSNKNLGFSDFTIGKVIEKKNFKFYYSNDVIEITKKNKKSDDLIVMKKDTQGNWIKGQKGGYEYERKIYYRYHDATTPQVIPSIVNSEFINMIKK